MRQPQRLEVGAGDAALITLTSAGREQQPQRHAELRPADAMKPRRLLGAPLHRHAAPSRPTRRRRRCPARCAAASAGSARRCRWWRKSGRQPMRNGADPHQQERGDERGLATDPVAVVAEDRRADRSSGEPDELRAEARPARRRTATGRGRTAWGRPARPPCRRGRSRTTRSWCRPCWRPRPAVGDHAAPTRHQPLLLAWTSRTSWCCGHRPLPPPAQGHGGAAAATRGAPVPVLTPQPASGSGGRQPEPDPVAAGGACRRGVASVERWTPRCWWWEGAPSA